MKKRDFPRLRIILLFSILFLLSSHAVAQDLKKFRHRLFTIELPSNCQLENEEKSSDMICYTYYTPNKKFICNYCVFTINEEFDLKERLREEAKVMDIDLDQTGYFGITTGTDSPLLCTMGEYDKFSLVMGIYPYFEKEKAIFICLIDAEKKDVNNLINMMSSFRPLK